MHNKQIWAMEFNMEWTPEADAAIKKVPFFVRKKVRIRVEKEAAAAGKRRVSIEDVKATQARYLSKMSSEVKGYRVDICFGPGGCPNRAKKGENLVEKIEALLDAENLLGFLKERVRGDLKLHHEFRVSLAECPNACSQPQIKDVGIIGAVVPKITDEDCTLCDVCVSACPEKCISIQTGEEKPKIDVDNCLKCARCVHVCPTGTIGVDRKGFRVQLGGKLGRHPRLATELDGLYTEEEALDIVRQCIAFYKKNSKNGERFAQIFPGPDFFT